MLIEECGSLAAVLEAGQDRLCRVPYIKENAALYLQLLGELSRRYAVAKFQPDGVSPDVVYDSMEKLATVLYPRFLGQSKELLIAILFDARMRMVDLFTVAEGSLNSVSLTARAVTQRAYQRNAAFCVLAHNHPGGIATPSQEDVRLTRDMETALDLVGVPLIEHLVFTERAYFPIVANCLQEQEPASLSKAAQYRKILYQSKKEK
jgi:DNA repair protein RadC